jgi:hypothetical protein
MIVHSGASSLILWGQNLVVRRRDALENFQALQSSLTPGSFVWQHTAHSAPQDLGRRSVVDGAFLRVGVHALPQEGVEFHCEATAIQLCAFASIGRTRLNTYRLGLRLFLMKEPEMQMSSHRTQTCNNKFQTINSGSLNVGELDQNTHHLLTAQQLFGNHGRQATQKVRMCVHHDKLGEHSGPLSGLYYKLLCVRCLPSSVAWPNRRTRGPSARAAPNRRTLVGVHSRIRGGLLERRIENILEDIIFSSKN